MYEALKTGAYEAVSAPFGSRSLLAPAASDPSELLLEQPVIKLLLGATHRHRNFPRPPGRRCLGRKRLGRKCLDPECKRRERNGRGGSGARGAVECRRVLPSSLVREVGRLDEPVGHVHDTLLQPLKLPGRRELREVRPCSTLGSGIGKDDSVIGRVRARLAGGAGRGRGVRVRSQASSNTPAGAMTTSLRFMIAGRTLGASSAACFARAHLSAWDEHHSPAVHFAGRSGCEARCPSPFFIRGVRFRLDTSRMAEGGGSSSPGTMGVQAGFPRWPLRTGARKPAVKTALPSLDSDFQRVPSSFSLSAFFRWVGSSGLFAWQNRW